MRAVLLAGGSGSRLRPLTCDLPKPMVPILNRPLAAHLIDLLERHGFTEVLITLHFLPDVIRDYFQDGRGLGVRLVYRVEEQRPLGTAGCVRNLADLLTDTFLVISGDSLTDIDLSRAIAFHRERQAKATLILTRVPNPLEFGVVLLGQENRVIGFQEKPAQSELLSDTVNTGIYILEPSVLQYVPAGSEADFSKDLFPKLLAADEPVYGYVADGYWCDIGNLDTYRQAQYAALQGRVNLTVPHPNSGQGRWIGENCHIDPTAFLAPPVLIGHNCHIGPNCRIGPYTVLGDNVHVGGGSELLRSVLWNGVWVEEDARLEGCLLARGSRVERRGQVGEGAVIGTLSSVGEESLVCPNVRVWPRKRIEAGVTLSSNLIWGNSVQRSLFGQRGISGLANVDITPEFAVKLGATYGSLLPPGITVQLSRDQRRMSQMIARALSAGLMSAGQHVANLEATALPIARTVLPMLGCAGGIHVRVDLQHADHILIEFLDEQGLSLGREAERSLENAYFKEDLRRANLDEIGEMSFPHGVLERYRSAFETQIDSAALSRSHSRIVIDYAYAVSGAVLPPILARYNCDAVILNASLRPFAPSTAEREVLLNQLGHVVEVLKATFGAQVTANGEQLTLVDEHGQPIRGEQLTGVMAELLLSAHPRSTVVVPVQVSSLVDRIAQRHDGRIVRSRANPAALMALCQEETNVVLGGCAEMGFIFPQLHPGFDAMLCLTKVLESLTIQERTLAQVRQELPQVGFRSCSVRCPWTVQGALMRHLLERHPTDVLDLTDGIKICDPHLDRWILVLPDGSEPLMNLYANGGDRLWVETVLQEYRQLIQSFVDTYPRWQPEPLEIDSEATIGI
jgi:mannose-1-phosphate guanylyltransferase/phosphomannomutase